jgi:thioredoxin-like negative regulator of GroEL
MAPLLDELARVRLGELLVMKLDTDRNPAMSMKYGIRGIPTLIVFRDGGEFARETGAIPRQRLDRLIESALAPGS